MAKPRVKVSDEKLRRKMVQYQRLLGKEVTQLVRNSSRLACIELSKFTQPYGHDAKAKDRGEGAIGFDISSIIKPLNDYWIEQFQSLYGNENSDRSLRRKDGTVWLKQTDKLLLSDSALNSFHQSKRSKATGRTTRAGLDGDRTIGRSRAQDLAFTRENLLISYIKSQVKKAGLVKAGWAAAALLVKADVRAPLRGIPRWVTRNIIASAAGVNDSKATGLGWKVSVTNKINYCRRVLSRTNEQIAKNVARKKMLSFMTISIRKTLPKKAGLA